MSSAISVERLSKVYRLGTISGGMLSEDLSRWWAKVRRRPDPLMKVGQEHHARRIGREFWALDDVSFDVQQGVVLGIVGRNGAGKSTLLKILSQVTAPTSGQIRIRGRIASLLEVGTGFHPELTGRENIFLNGAILGMTKGEIRRKFDEIVAFSEIEDLIDTPVKRYSSGMYVRLAFAVAAHLEPEILIIDEVLAVGDAQFQKKCLGKMQDVGRQGRTVLFVSHTMAAVTRLCSRAVLLSQGRVTKEGLVEEVVSEYLRLGSSDATPFREWTDPETAPGGHAARLLAIRVRGEGNAVSSSFEIRSAITIETEYQLLRDGQVLIPTIMVHNSEGVCAFTTLDCDTKWHRQPRAAGRYTSRLLIPGNLLAEGRFGVSVALITAQTHTVHANAPDAVSFEVIDNAGGNTARGDYTLPLSGVTRPMLSWTTSFQPE